MPSKPQKRPKAKKNSPALPYPKAVEKPVRDRLLDAALYLASLQGWEHCAVRDIAREAGLSLSDFYDHYDDRTDVLVAYGRRLDKQVLANFTEDDFETPVRDRLFDILMERFDLANQDRAAVVSILKSFRLDPKQMVISLPHLGASMTKMLEAAGLDTTGLRGAARVAGLTAAYVWILRTWVEDESPDLSRTMAQVDKCLNHLERAANTFGL